MDLTDTASSSSVIASSSSPFSNTVPAPTFSVQMAQDLDSFSMVRATEILVSMDDLNDETKFQALKKLEKLEWRQVLITLNPDLRRGWIEHLTVPAQVPDPFSMVKATEILVSISDNDDTMFKALEKLVKPEWRKVLITLNPETRRGWIEHLASLT
ncbi:uncharacterized protein LOC126715719 [Quercus robur]|uniref:uncharacterized protein LOC126715719 n=1 Tax=Quercus robur TaxID=38942 RepID=UPI002162D0F0|nr:uncharacterized protein LOC126715719 [Quercus robur]